MHTPEQARELLERAARAAGIALADYDESVRVYECPHYGGAAFRLSDASPYSAESYWNPLTDDGDALRLAVKLGINVHPGKGDEAWTRAISVTAYADERPSVDRCAATRLAIVRAAAEMAP